MKNKHEGFILIETLIAVVILLFGLLALAALINKMIVFQVESYQRSQASLLLMDMTSRISANSAGAASYVGAAVGGSAGTVATCSGSGATLDRCEWGNALNGSTETKGGGSTAKIGAVSGAYGCIEAMPTANSFDPVPYRVTVAWQGFSQTNAPASGVTCGQNQFGSNDALRRAIVATVVVPKLACDPSTPSTC